MKIVDDFVRRLKQAKSVNLSLAGDNIIDRFVSACLSEEKWITIGGKPSGDESHKGGFPVQIDGQGNILKGGPKSLQGKNVKSVKAHFDQERGKSKGGKITPSPEGTKRPGFMNVMPKKDEKSSENQSPTNETSAKSDGVTKMNKQEVLDSLKIEWSRDAGRNIMPSEKKEAARKLLGELKEKKHLQFLNEKGFLNEDGRGLAQDLESSLMPTKEEMANQPVFTGSKITRSDFDKMKKIGNSRGFVVDLDMDRRTVLVKKTDRATGNTVMQTVTSLADMDNVITSADLEMKSRQKNTRKLMAAERELNRE